MSSDIKTENLAKKLANSHNQKCNFKYLMNSKTNRSLKTSHPSKENQIQSVIINSAHKLANKTSKNAKYDSQIMDNRRMPLCLQSITLTNREISQESLELQKQKYGKQDSVNLEIQSKIKTDVSQIATQSIACMTDDCYHEKELLLKIDLLKKQRDDIWNSISDIVKQNLTLKQLVAEFTIDSKTLQTVFVQTEVAQLIEIEIQTDLQGEHIDRQSQNYLKSKKDLQEAQSLCLRILSKDNYTCNVPLKDLLLETLNINMINSSSQFQKEKTFLMSFHSHQIEQLKKVTDRLRAEVEHTNVKLQESMKLNENTKKIYEKEIEEIKNLVLGKQLNFINEILQIKQDWQDIVKNNQIKNKFYLQYFENTKYCFKQKQTMYSTLLSQSHKTISNLMAQLKQFQVMANSNYYKHLKSQRSQHNFEKIFRTFE